MSIPIIAIVGRPNVGKSTLFNRLLGFQKAIVHNEPGVTRDRHYGEAEWSGKKFTIIDTGGYVPNSKNIFEKAIKEQTQIAIEESNQILFIVDGSEGLTGMDIEIANHLRKSTILVHLVINKVDNNNFEMRTAEFEKLGFKNTVSIAAIHGRKVGDLLDEITKNISIDKRDDSDDDKLKIAIIGKPNVGKSSLANMLIGKERSIVTHIAGTTRDTIDTNLNYQGKKLTLIDTAGLIKQKRLKTSVDFYSAVRTIKAIDRCNVAVVLFDAVEDFNKQDLHIVELAIEKRKSVLIVINKWDLVEKDDKTMLNYENFINSKLRKFNYLPQLYISAKTKKRARMVLDEALKIDLEQCKRIKTSELNSYLLDVIKNNPPSTKTGKDIKINFITQIQIRPPHIMFFASEPQMVQENYKRFLENKIREKWKFRGVPLHLTFKKKRKKDMIFSE